ncbi:hypothetical protein HY837_04635 [archaeon]|nr:hypothetical protein [archaeon]
MQKPKPISQELDVVLKQLRAKVVEPKLEETVSREEVNILYAKKEVVENKYVSTYKI